MEVKFNNRRIEHTGVLYEFLWISGNDVYNVSDNGAAGWLERQFPDEKERNEVRGRMIEQVVKSGKARRVEPKKVELVKGGLFYMEEKDDD
jgi:hypothetical protein